MPTSLRGRIKAGKFVTTVELEPPKGTCLEKVLRYAKALKGYADAVNITDCPMANLRMSPIAIASIIRRELDLDAIFHLTCRDRNVIGLQSELLGAAALGVESILALTGDDPERGDHPQARGVFEVSSVGLVGLASNLNKGLDQSGNVLNGRTQFYIGVAANPAAKDPGLESDRVQQKAASGAHFIQTQPVYDPELLLRFMERLRPLELPVVAGVLPLKSTRMVDYIMKNVPDINIPQHVAKSIQQGGRVAGVRLTQNLIEELRPLVAGVHIMPVGSARIALEILGAVPLADPQAVD